MRDDRLRHKDEEIITDRFDALLAQALSPAIADEELIVVKKENVTPMRKWNKKVAAITAIAACLAIGTSCFAAGKIVSFRSGMHSTDYAAMADMEQVQSDAGFEIVPLPESFENGYTFASANVHETQAMDENENVMKNYNNIFVYYEKEDSSLFVSAREDILGVEAKEEAVEAVETRNINGIQVDAYAYNYKFVPTDYELTEEDKAFLEIPGNYISYGDDVVEETGMCSVQFVKDGIYYSIMDINSSDTIKILFELAGELLSE